MMRGWLAVLLVFLVLLIVGCGESKLARAKRVARAGVPDDPPPADVQPQVPGPPAPASTSPSKAPAIVANPPQPAASTNVAPAVPGPPSPAPVQAPAATVPQPPAPSAPIVIDTPRPATPLSADERRARSLQNLTAIAAAFESYTQISNSMPEQAFTDENTQAPLLSWRVALLPQLGHGQLYSQFKLDQRWDSPHNRQLLKQIPPEYLSPERFDEKTNYLCPVGPAVAMAQKANRPFTQFKDGLANTIVLVEVDDAHAVPWTRPDDWPLNLESPQAGLGSVRGDGFLALLGNATLVKVPATTPAEKLRALFTFAGGDGPKALDIVQDAAGNALPGAAAASPPPPAVAVNVAENKPEAAPIPAASPQPAAPPSAAPQADLAVITALLAAGPVAREGLSPVPSEAESKVAKDLLREVYAKDYAAAKNLDEKQKLAQQLIADALTVQENRAEQYEMLRIARDLAVQGGNVATAMRAVSALEGAFVLDALALRAKTLGDLQAAAGRNPQWDLMQNEARKLLNDALQQNHFDAATTAQELFLARARVLGDKAAIAQASYLRDQIDVAREAYAAVPAALGTLSQQPADPKACETVGQYLCLVRHRWDLGLPLLAKCENIKLRFVASIDLETGKTPKTLVQLGDSYWQLAGELKGPQQAALQARGASCYNQALPQLASGLERIKVQKRLHELVAALGQEQIEQLAGQKIAATPVGGAPVTGGIRATGRPDPNAQFE